MNVRPRLIIPILIFITNYSFGQVGDTLFQSKNVIAVKDVDSSFTMIVLNDDQKVLKKGRAYFKPGSYEDEWGGFEIYRSLEDFLQYTKGKDEELNSVFVLKTGVWEEKNYSGNTEFINYDKGVAFGTAYILNEDKDTLGINNYKNGERDGICLEFNIDKNVIDTTTYINGKKEGPYNDYYLSGKIMERGHYENDKKVGVWRQFSPFGDVNKIDYDNKKVLTSTVKVGVSKRNENQDEILLSVNSEFALGNNGKFKVLYNLKKSKIVKGMINVNPPSPAMGQKRTFLSNTGKYLLTNLTSNYKWNIDIKSLLEPHEFSNDALTKKWVRGYFYDFDEKDQWILYSVNGFLKTQNIQNASKDSIKLENINAAAFSSNDQYIYVVQANKVSCYDRNMVLKDSLIFEDFKITDSIRTEVKINNDQVIIYSILNDQEGQYEIPELIWIDIKSRSIEKVEMPKGESLRYESDFDVERFYTMIDPAHNMVLCQTDHENKVFYYYLKNKGWSKLDNAIQNIHGISIDGAIIYDYIKYYNPGTSKKRSFSGLAPSLNIQNVEFCKETIALNKNVNISLHDLSIKDEVKTCEKTIDSTYIDKIENYQRYEEVIHYVEQMNSKFKGYNYRNNLYYLNKDHAIGQLSFTGQENTIILENFQKKNRIEQVVYLNSGQNKSFVFHTPDQYYAGQGDYQNLIFFEKGSKTFPFEQFDLKYNRPDIILDRLGYADSSLIAAYHSAYKKRLKKMGFTEDMLEDDFHLPEIEIKNFEEMPNLIDDDKININLHMKDSKYKLDRINIWVNDVAIYGTDGITLRDLNTQKLDKTVKVNLAKGKNKVQVSVLNQAGAESYKETFEIICPKGKKKPDLYLVTIGESEFEQADYNLTYAAKDAKDIVGLFSNSKVYQSVMTKTLTNEQVTRENVLDLKAFLKKADINDHVMIFIAGHGVLSAGLDYYLATYDMDFQNPEEKGLLYQDLEGLLDGIKPLKKTLILDACHSGEIDKEEVELVANENTTTGTVKFRAVGKNVKSKLGAQNTLELTRSLFTDLRKGTGSTVISSAGGMEFAMEGEEWNNGLFTYTLIDGVKSGKADLNEDGEIWMSELKEYVSNQVIKLSNGKQQPTSRIENQTVDFRVW